MESLSLIHIEMGIRDRARVAWEETEEEKYQKAGAFTVYGTCEGLEQKAAANVTMIDAAVKPAEMKSPAGKYPALPYTIKPVSYTHLDVYKRQVSGQINFPFCCMDSKTPSLSFRSVSMNIEPSSSDI